MSLPKKLVEAAERRSGERGLSGVIGAALSAYLGVPYTPPPLGRPKIDDATPGG